MRRLVVTLSGVVLAVSTATAAVVINEIHYNPDVKTEPAEFVEFVTELFMQRRKQLGGALKRLGLDVEQASAIVEPTMRAEQLTAAQFAALWKLKS